jgi:tetratricopeptide (TPR) repeat protein
MNAGRETPDDDQLLELLAACDDALAAGRPPSLNADTPADQRSRLERRLASMKLLREVLPEMSSDSSVPWFSPDGMAEKELLGGLPFSQLGRYQIRRQIGQGSCGIVFLAYDPQLCREVALKVPRAEALLSPPLRERFLREARAAAGLDHPNVVPVYEASEVGPICFIASAYCPGVTLAAWLKQRTEPVPFRLAATLVQTLAQAVQHAHDRSVVHRDLKPANILLQTKDEGGRTKDESEPSASSSSFVLPPSSFLPKVTDFGLAKLLAAEESGQTHSGVILGTPSYMAPAQADGKTRELGPAADVYALGAILYELLTGRPPFRGETPLETLEQVRTTEPVAPRHLRPGLPRDLETICLKCIEKDPGRRYAGAADLATDVGRFLAGEPVRARPVGMWGRAVKWARRRPAVTALVAMLGLVGFAALGSITALWLQAQEERDQAQQERDVAAAARDEAEANFRLAKKAVDDCFILTTTHPLLREERMRRVRKLLLEQALPFYEGFQVQHQDAPNLLDQQARNYQSVGLILRELGRWPETERAFHQAEEKWEQLIRARPEEDNHRNSLAHTLSARGVTFRHLGQVADAARCYERAVAIGEKLVAASPSVMKYQDTLAFAYNNLGTLQSSQNQASATIHSFERAQRWYEKLVADHPEVAEHQCYLANTYANLGAALCNGGKREGGLELLHKALEIQSKLATAHPEVSEYRADLAGTCNRLGAYHLESDPHAAVQLFDRARRTYGELAAAQPDAASYRLQLAGSQVNVGNALKSLRKRDEALNWYAQASAVLEDMRRQAPKDAWVREYLHNARWGWGWTLNELGRYREALAVWDRAIELVVGSERDETRLERARALAHTGEHARAAVEVADVTRQASLPGEWLYRGAQIVAVAAGAARQDAATVEGYARQAVQLLQRARAAGRFPDAASVEDLRTRPEFEPLRKRVDFQKLMDELGKPK